MTKHNDTHNRDNDDVMPDNTDEAKGRAKQAVGALTGDEDLQREGRTDQTEGDVKDKIDGLADKAKGFVDDVRARIDR